MKLRIDPDVFTQLVDLNTTRRCNDCDVCCTALEVFDLQPPKKIGERCQHQCNDKAGCQIYDNRPKSCKEFYCTWRMAEVIKIFIPNRLKPSKCGFVLSWDPMVNPVLMTLFKDPKRPDAWKKYKRELEAIAKENNVCIGIGGGYDATHVLSPRGNWFDRKLFPWLFNGLSVGVPREEFNNGRPNKRWGH